MRALTLTINLAEGLKEDAGIPNPGDLTSLLTSLLQICADKLVEEICTSVFLCLRRGCL